MQIEKKKLKIQNTSSTVDNSPSIMDWVRVSMKKLSQPINTHNEICTTSNSIQDKQTASVKIYEPHPLKITNTSSTIDKNESIVDGFHALRKDRA